MKKKVALPILKNTGFQTMGRLQKKRKYHYQTRLSTCSLCGAEPLVARLWKFISIVCPNHCLKKWLHGNGNIDIMIALWNKMQKIKK